MERCPRCRQPVAVSAHRMPTCTTCGLGGTQPPGQEPTSTTRVDGMVVTGVVLVALAVASMLAITRGPHVLGVLGLGFPFHLLLAGVGIGLITARFLSNPTQRRTRPSLAPWAAIGFGAALAAALVTFMLGPWGVMFVYPLLALAGTVGLVVVGVATARWIRHERNPSDGWNLAVGAVTVAATVAVFEWMRWILDHFEWT